MRWVILVVICCVWFVMAIVVPSLVCQALMLKYESGWLHLIIALSASAWFWFMTLAAGVWLLATVFGPLE